MPDTEYEIRDTHYVPEGGSGMNQIQDAERVLVDHTPRAVASSLSLFTLRATSSCTTRVIEVFCASTAAMSDAASTCEGRNRYASSG